MTVVVDLGGALQLIESPSSASPASSCLASPVSYSVSSGSEGELSCGGDRQRMVDRPETTSHPARGSGRMARSRQRGVVLPWRGAVLGGNTKPPRARRRFDHDDGGADDPFRYRLPSPRRLLLVGPLAPGRSRGVRH